MKVIWKPIFDNKMKDRAHVIDVFNRHNQSVIDEVPADRLLVFDANDGWKPLCDFLEMQIPDTDYPRVNTTEQFQNRTR